MSLLSCDKVYLVLTGNYGSGKTEIALNLALESAKRMKTTLVDLDIVNPYFRSGEKADDLRNAGVRTLMPTYAMTTVDIPALPAEIQSVFEVPSDRVIFDVGGDDTGAAALGRYYPSFTAKRNQTKMILVINCMRPLTQDEEDIIDLAESMIRLSGFEPYQDIDIVETGLRPGEKLYEELLVNKEEMTKTPNEKIFIEKDTVPSRQEIDEALAKLEKACDTCDDAEVRKTLQEIVPSYQPN